MPADWHDIDEDRILDSKTIPLTYGPRTAGMVVMITLSISVVLSALLFAAAPGRPSVVTVILVVAAGVYMLILPAHKLYKTSGRVQAGDLFSKASFYQPVVFGLFLIDMLFLS